MAKQFILALDAGHYLGTPGKRCMKSLDANETREWVLNNRVAEAFQERAAEYEGFVVVRMDDPTGQTETTLQQRVALANAINADFYLSPHHNAGMNGKRGGGIVAYCSKGSTKSPAWRDMLYDASIAAGGIRGNRTEPKAKANWYVCVNTNMPAVLMEYGFMDSPDDVPVILDPEYSRRMGIAAADAIAKKAELKLKPKATTAPVEVPVEEITFTTLEEIPEAFRRVAAQMIECGAVNGWGDERGLDLTVRDLRHLAWMIRYVDHAIEMVKAEPAAEIEEQVVNTG